MINLSFTKLQSIIFIENKPNSNSNELSSKLNYSNNKNQKILIFSNKGLGVYGIIKLIKHLGYFILRIF